MARYMEFAARIAPVIQAWLERETGIQYPLQKMGKRCDLHNVECYQRRPQDFGLGVNAPLPPEVKKILKI